MNQRVLTDRRYIAALMRGLRGLMSHYLGSENNTRQAGLSGNDDHRSNIPGNIPFIRHQHSLTFTRLLPFPGSAFALGTSMSWAAKYSLDPL